MRDIETPPTANINKIKKPSAQSTSVATGELATAITMGENTTDTVQSVNTALTVYVEPTNVPPQVPPTEAEYPVAGVRVKLGCDNATTVCEGVGVIVPLPPETLGVTV